MPLKLYKRPNGIFHIRGTVQGKRVDESARTRVRAEAEQIRAKLETGIFRRSVYGDDAVATFAEAAEAYMQAGGAREHLKLLLLRFGELRLSDIGQRDIDALAAERKVKPSTLLRQIYTPMSAVLTFAASDAGGNLCRAPSFRKPTVRSGRTAYLRPAEVDEWIDALPSYLASLVTFMVGTGCRITEALELQWRDVTPDNLRVVFWETKGGYARGVDLQARVRAALPARGEGHVFRNSFGEPWHAYDAINLSFRKMRAPVQRKTVRKPRERREGRPDLAPLHCHLLRHTWATWAYACTRDVTFLMQMGGWKSLNMVQRYTHVGSPDLARDVLAHKWEFHGRELSGLVAKNAPTP